MNNKYGLKKVPDFKLTFDNNKEIILDTLKSVEEYYTQDGISFYLVDALLDFELENIISTAQLLTVKKVFFARRAIDGSDIEMTKDWSGKWEISMNYKTKTDGDPAEINIILTLK